VFLKNAALRGTKGNQFPTGPHHGRSVKTDRCIQVEAKTAATQ